MSSAGINAHEFCSPTIIPNEISSDVIVGAGGPRYNRRSGQPLSSGNICIK